MGCGEKRMADPRETHMVDGMWIQRQINFGLDKKSHSLIARCPKSALFKYCQLIISVMVMACIFILTSRHWMRYWEEVHGIMKNWNWQWQNGSGLENSRRRIRGRCAWTI